MPADLPPMPTPDAPAPTAAPPAPAPAPLATPAPQAVPAPAPGSPSDSGTAPQPGQPTAGAPSAFVSDDGTLNFQALTLPPDLAASIGDRVPGFRDRFEGKHIGEILKSHNELEATLSQRPSAPKEATAAAYGIQRPEGVDDAAWASDVATIQPYIDAAHAAGLSPEQFQPLLAVHAQAEQARAEAEAQQAAQAKLQATQEIRQHWGPETDAKRATSSNYLQQRATALGIPLTDPGLLALADNPTAIRLFHDAALVRGEDGTTIPRGGMPTALSKAEQGADIMRNPNNPLHQKFLDGDPATLAHIETLRSSLG